MTEKPIIFNTEMVRAILDGRKTQTRRVIKPQPEFNGIWFYKGDVFLSDSIMQDHLLHNVYGSKRSPYGAVYGDGSADTLWVRETWATFPEYDLIKLSELKPISTRIFYRADGDGKEFVDRWRPSIFMPRWASRMTLRIEDIRIERVQDISRADIEAEGTPPKPGQMCYRNDYYQLRKDFQYLWDGINTKRGFSWKSNPWVWVIEFSIAEPYELFGNWATVHGYDLDDDDQREEAIKAYGSE